MGDEQPELYEPRADALHCQACLGILEESDIDFCVRMRLSIHPDCFLRSAQTVKLEDLGLKHQDKPLCLQGTVLLKSAKKIVVRASKFDCPSCGNQHIVRPRNGELFEPERCSCGRRGRFIHRGDDMDEAFDITLQDKGASVQLKNIPLDLDRNTKPGDRITVLGTLIYQSHVSKQKRLQEATAEITVAKLSVDSQGGGISPDEYLKSVGGFTFEEVVAKILVKKGYDAQVTSKTGDGGIDIYAVKNGVRTAVQCKHHYDKQIGRPELDKLIGVMHSQKITEGLFVCTGTFSPSAIELALKENVKLWDKDIVLREMGQIESAITAPTTKPVWTLSSLTGAQLKDKIQELKTKFVQRFREVRDNTPESFVPIDTIKPLFTVDQWTFVWPYLERDGYNINYNNCIEHWERSTEPGENKIVLLKTILDQLSEHNRMIPIETIKEAAAQKGIPLEDMPDLISKLKRSGDVFEPKQGHLSKI